MSNLVPSSVSGTLVIQSMDDLARLAALLDKSKFFTDARDAAQCGVKLLAGLELGIPAFASMTGIHIIKGKPALSANVMAAMIKRSPKYNYKVKTLTAELCEIEFFENNESVGISSFSIAEGKKAGTQNLDRFPRNMLFARALSNGVRWYAPDIFCGAPVYTPEELGATVNEEGEVIDVQVQEKVDNESVPQ